MMHLAELIEDELQERGWDLDRLTDEAGPYDSEHEWQVSRAAWDFFMEVREPNMLLGDRGSIELGKAFDIDPQFFLNFHESWRQSVLKTK
jgi:hypothetical protein